MLIILIILICMYFGFKYGFSEIETDSKKQEKLKKIAVKMKKISVKEEDNEIDEAMIIGGLIDTYSDTISNSFVDSTADCSCMASHSCDCHNNCD